MGRKKRNESKIKIKELLIKLVGDSINDNKNNKR